MGVGAGVDGLDAGQDMAEIQGGPGDAWAKGIGVGAALEKAGDFAGLKAEVAVESDAREEVCGLDADTRGGGSQGALGGTNIRPPAQQVGGVADVDQRRQGRNGGGRG